MAVEVSLHSTRPLVTELGDAAQRPVAVAYATQTTVLLPGELPSQLPAEAAPDELLQPSPGGALVLVDDHGRLVAVNSATERMFGYPRDELLGRPVSMLIGTSVPELSGPAAISVRPAPGVASGASHPVPSEQVGERLCNDQVAAHSGVRYSVLGERVDGTSFPIEVQLHPFSVGAGGMVLTILRAGQDLSGGTLGLQAVDDVEDIVSFQRELTAEAALGGGIPSIARALERRTSRVVTVEDAEGRLLFSTATESSDASPATVVRDSALFERAAHAVAIRTGNRWVAFARPNGHVLGTISLHDPDDDVGRAALPALEQAAGVLSMELFRLRSIADVELSVWGDLASELLESPDMSRIRSHARILGYDLDRPHRAVLVLGTGCDPEELYDAVGRVARRSGLNATLLTPRNAGVALLLTEDPDWAELARGIATEARGTVQLGVGGRHAAEDAARSLADAELALRLAATLGDGGPVALFDDLGVWRIFARSAPEQLADLVDHWIGRLIDYDGRHSTELVKTLAVYLREAGAIDATAAKLFVHRNTLKYRLNRVSTLTGWDLSDPEQRFNLDLACRAHTTMQALVEGERAPSIDWKVGRLGPWKRDRRRPTSPVAAVASRPSEVPGLRVGGADR